MFGMKRRSTLSHACKELSLFIMPRAYSVMMLSPVTSQSLYLEDVQVTIRCFWVFHSRLSFVAHLSRYPEMWRWNNNKAHEIQCCKNCVCTVFIWNTFFKKNDPVLFYECFTERCKSDPKHIALPSHLAITTFFKALYMTRAAKSPCLSLWSVMTKEDVSIGICWIPITQWVFICA